jgi:hypothetical protein
MELDWLELASSYANGVEQQSPGSRSAPWGGIAHQKKTPTGFHNDHATLAVIL